MIYHYFAGGSSGVARFDGYLRRVFPDMKSMRARLDAAAVDDEGEIVCLEPGDIVVTDNHLSVGIVLDGVKVTAVHHGCGACHFARDPGWRNDRTRYIVELQRRMFDAPNRTFVAPSAWVAEQFKGEAYRDVVDADWSPGRPEYSATVIPHWVDPIPPLPKSGKPIVIGDWRDNNKGANVWKKLAAACPQWDFAPLNFRDDAGRRKQYGEASLYLCLSLSEGGSYSMCDAEAAELPICSTDVGNYREFDDCEVIPWQNRDDVGMVAEAIERKLKAGRRKPSFYRECTFEAWKAAWEAVIQ